jgi:Xaa-Pro aminopeptidase
VIVDFVARRFGYHGDMTRTFSVGAVSDEIVSAYSAVREAQAAAIAAIKPGVTCEDVDRIARDVIEGEGLGDYFTHRLGHGIGLDVHEPPYLVQGNKQKLEIGMCVTVEPGVYVPDQFGIRIEDVIAVTENGCEILSASVPTDLSDCFR